MRAAENDSLDYHLGKNDTDIFILDGTFNK